MKRISIQLAAISMTCVLITGLFVGGFSVWKASKAVQDQAERNLLSQAESYAKQMERMTAETVMLVRNANSIITANANKTDLDTDIITFIDKTQQVIQVMADNVDFNTNLYATLIPEYAIDDKLVNLVYMREGDSFVLTELPWYVDNMEEQAENLVWFTEPIRLERGYWTDIYYDPNIELWMISYCEPIKTENGIIGVVGMDVNFELLSGIISQVSFYKSGFASMIDDDYYFISHPIYEHTDNLADVNSGQLEGLVQAISSRESGIYTYVLNGVEMITAFAPVENEFTVITTIVKSEVMEEVVHYRESIVMVILVIILILVVAAYFLGRQLGRPIEQAAEHAREIMLGEFEGILPVEIMNRQDEIGVLGQALTDMRISLKNMIQERDSVLKALELNNSELESRVQMRTTELEDLNKKLMETIENLNETQVKLFRAEKLSTLVYMISGLAHEINTPMGICITSSSYLVQLSNAFKQYLQALNVREKEPLAFAEEAKGAAVLIENNLNNMVKLLDKLKVYSEIKEADMKDGFYVCSIMREIYANVKGKLKPNQILKISCSDDVLVSGDSKAFMMIMNVLIENSIMHGFDGKDNGEIRIEVMPKDLEVEIVFEDTGKGILPKEVQHIFDPFYTTRRGRGNMGLGLFTAYEIMTLHFNGEVILDTSFTGGSRFILKFPSREIDM